MRYAIIYLLPITIISVLLIYYMKPISHWLGNSLYPNMENTGHQEAVAKIQDMDGNVVARYSSGEKPLSKGSHVHNYDRIQVGDKSYIVLNFPFHYTLKFSENSQFLVELWDQKKKETSPVYIYIKYGEYEMIQQGQKGRLFLIKNNRQFTPEEGIPPQQGLTLVTPTNPMDPSQTPQTSPHQQPQTTTSYPSTEYIEKMVAAQLSHFEKCLIDHANDRESLKGDTLIGFSILNTGRVQDVAVIKSQIKNKPFEGCIVRVFQALIFKPFNGNMIDFTYPMSFN